ncbi:hypothetical protein [Haladaptatus sp. ZSTT2]|uniref:hypothetical protein n=1 Tax=Haladaptatus sp. ZSTT2 TaxID=3120515 RepID=UPI00300E76B5
MTTKKAALIGMLVVMSVLIAGTGGVAAQSDGDTTASDSSVVELGSFDMTISDLKVTISDTHLRGTGLPEESIDEAHYTLEESHIETDGFLITVNDTTYQICAIDIVFDEVGLEIQNVSSSDA